MIEKLWCDECKEWITPVEGVTAIYSRGCWWCAKHAAIYMQEGEAFIDFPSKGKLIPRTIMTKEKDDE